MLKCMLGILFLIILLSMGRIDLEMIFMLMIVVRVYVGISIDEFFDIIECNLLRW